MGFVLVLVTQDFACPRLISNMLCPLSSASRVQGAQAGTSEPGIMGWFQWAYGPLTNKIPIHLLSMNGGGGWRPVAWEKLAPSLLYLPPLPVKAQLWVL